MSVFDMWERTNKSMLKYKLAEVETLHLKRQYSSMIAECDLIVTFQGLAFNLI